MNSAALLCLAFLASSAVAQKDSPPFKALGAPSHPKVAIAWNRYYSSQEIEQLAAKLAQAFPQLVQKISIGKSYGGRPLTGLIVTNQKTGSDRCKAAMYIDGNIHSNEIQGAEVALYTAWYLTENYGQVDWITDLVDRKTLYILPTINPDARDYYLEQANSPHSPRSGLMPRDDDGDGLLDEDGPDDLDGDGNIVGMRRRDPNGRWKADPDDPRMMVRCKPDEQGQFTLLGDEGLDNDADGAVNEDGVGYYDSNRNWAWLWQPEYVQDGADYYPFSIPEIRCVAEFVLNHPNIAGAQSYHNSGGIILRGPGSAQDEKLYDRRDLRLYDFLGKLGEEMLPGYEYQILYKDMYTVYGGELDWFYACRGVYCFTNELWSSFDYFRKKDKDSNWISEQKQTYRFDKLLLFSEGLVDWKPYRHPQYGEVEIGGIKKAWTRTAPSFMLEDMCHRNMAFTLFHAYHLPQLQCDSVHVHKIQADVYQVDMVIKNERALPTRSWYEVEKNLTRPDFISLQASVIAGFVVKDPFLNIVQEQKYNPERLAIASIPGMETIQVRWLVAGPPPYKWTMDSAKGGMFDSVIH